jgi:hypothetical protein
MGIHGEIANESFIKQMKTAYTTPDQCKLAVSKMNHNLPNFPKVVPWCCIFFNNPIQIVTWQKVMMAMKIIDIFAISVLEILRWSSQFIPKKIGG